jgi:hypothetical protein
MLHLEQDYPQLIINLFLIIATLAFVAAEESNDFDSFPDPNSPNFPGSVNSLLSLELEIIQK